MSARMGMNILRENEHFLLIYTFIISRKRFPNVYSGMDSAGKGETKKLVEFDNLLILTFNTRGST